MMPIETPWITTGPLPPSAAVLGRLVEDITCPERQFQDTFHSKARPNCPEPTINETVASSFKMATSNARSVGFSGFLTTLVGTSFGYHNDVVVNVAAEKCKTRTLSRSSQYFLEASSASPVRDWLEVRWKRSGTIYMVVGIKYMEDSEVELQKGYSNNVKLHVGIPGSLILGAVTQGAVTSLGGIETILDSGITTSRGRKTTATSRYSVSGESILAIQFRRIKFSWRKKSSIESLGLKDELPWTVYLGSRGGDASDTEEDDSDCEGEFQLEAEAGGPIHIQDIGPDFEFKEYTIVSPEESHPERMWHVRQKKE